MCEASFTCSSFKNTRQNTDGMLQTLLTQKCLYGKGGKGGVLSAGMLKMSSFVTWKPSEERENIWDAPTKNEGSVKWRACYLPTFTGLVYSALLSPAFALSGIKWSENAKQVDLNGDCGDSWAMSLLREADAPWTGWLITQISCRVKIHRGVIRCLVSRRPFAALLKARRWPWRWLFVEFRTC